MTGAIDKIALLGREFTIQTELVPGEPPVIRTLVYDGGRLVTSRELSLDPSITTDQAIEAKVRDQHQRITDTLIQRAAELQSARTRKPPRPEPAAPPTATPAAAKKTPPRPEVEPRSRLATAFSRPAPGTAEGYTRSLEAVDAAIDAIRDAPTYDTIRLDEQLTLIALKSQLETWRLADRDLAMATEIWPTVESFAHHLQKINHRGDLVSFDQRMLTWAIGELGRGRVTDEMIDGLRGLGGRDAELDGVLRDPTGVEPLQLLEMLLRLMDQTLA
jgi:hypothetical protein